MLHGDDLGMARSINRASFRALEQRWITSASGMVPAPYFDEVVQFAKANPSFDIGLHLTLTSESERARYKPILPKKDVPSLVDRTGHLLLKRGDLLRQADPDDIQKEIRAQIEASLRQGFRPTHLDSHMSVLEGREDLRAICSAIGREMGIPTRADAERKIGSLPTGLSRDERSMWYLAFVMGLKPGTWELVVHLGFEDEELSALTKGMQAWNAEWRQSDMDFVSSPMLLAAIRKQGIKLTNWSRD